MINKHTYLFISIFALTFCNKQFIFSQSTHTLIEMKAPIWVGSRPNNEFKYIGIGFSEKNKGGNYQIEAKKNALYDLSSEIKVNISSNSVLYTFQNNNTFNENFNSLIKLSNSDNIEGYTLIDSYENEKQYWIYYQLDKSDYANQKALKKQQIIIKASNLINGSFLDEKNRDFSASLKKRIQAFGILNPYLSEEINFVPSETNGLKNVFDLTNLIQNQLKTINVVNQNAIQILKPYQQVYAPLFYRLELNNKISLQNFPLLVQSDNEKITVSEKTSTNNNGEVQIKINSVEPLLQYVSFSLSPDIFTLMDSDSIGSIGVKLLKPFIQTNALKVQANVTSIVLYVTSIEKNFGKVTSSHLIEMFIKQKFNGQEIRLTDNIAEADYIIESEAETSEDISSDILEKNYDVKLAALIVNIRLKNNRTNVLEYKTQVNDVYGYANSLDNAGLNAYSNSKLNTKLSESLFFLKRKILVY